VKSMSEELRSILDAEADVRHMVVVFQVRGKKPQAVHNFETTAQAIAFVNETLRLTDEELLKIMRGRQH
jgi:hypothetical protein